MHHVPKVYPYSPLTRLRSHKAERTTTGNRHAHDLHKNHYCKAARRLVALAALLCCRIHVDSQNHMRHPERWFLFQTRMLSERTQYTARRRGKIKTITANVSSPSIECILCCIMRGRYCQQTLEPTLGPLIPR